MNKTWRRVLMIGGSLAALTLVSACAYDGYGYGYGYGSSYGYGSGYGYGSSYGYAPRTYYRDHRYRYDRDNNPPGPRGGPGTNWENPPGPRGGPGASPDRRYPRHR